MPGFSLISSLFVSLSVIIGVRVLVSLIWYSSYCHSRLSVIFTPTPKHSCVQPLPQYLSSRNLRALEGPGIGYLKKTLQYRGVFHSTKILVWKFENSTCQMERFIPVSQIRSKPQGVCLLFLLQAGSKERYWGQQFCQMEGTFRSDRPKWVDWSKWTTFKGGPKYSGRAEPEWFIPFDFWPKVADIWGEWKPPQKNWVQ